MVAKRKANWVESEIPCLVDEITYKYMARQITIYSINKISYILYKRSSKVYNIIHILYKISYTLYKISFIIYKIYLIEYRINSILACKT